MHVSALARYPVKSCRGHAVTAAEVEPWGLAGDRRWMVVDADGRFLSARTRPRMILVTPAIVPGGGLALAAPDTEPLAVAVPADGPVVEVEVWGDRVKATPAGESAHAWFSAYLGEELRLVYLDDPTRRPTDPDFSRPGDRVTFADGFPLLLTATASLVALEELVGEPVSMTRFRPNVVVDGGRAWAEEGWSAVTVGDARFRVAKPCSRCVLTTVDPETAEKGKEPLAGLARHRRRGTVIPFGVNLVPDTPGLMIHVGDEVVPE